MNSNRPCSAHAAARSSSCRLLAAADRYAEADWPLPRAAALESAAAEFARAGDGERAAATRTAATEIYAWLGAAADTARLQAAP
ncbi:MAG: hypothetical protein ACRDPY_11305 [Streptosporangiaceae bacterium]